jgi:hypothetical protein
MIVLSIQLLAEVTLFSSSFIVKGLWLIFSVYSVSLLVLENSSINYQCVSNVCITGCVLRDGTALYVCRCTCIWWGDRWVWHRQTTAKQCRLQVVIRISSCPRSSGMVICLGLVRLSYTTCIAVPMRFMQRNATILRCYTCTCIRIVFLMC